MKSDEVIAFEIALLMELAKIVPEDIQGHNRAVIAAQIDTLAHRLNTGQVHDGFLARFPGDLFADVLHASDWAHGLLSPEHDCAPSVEWRDVVKYEDGAKHIDGRARAALEHARRAQHVGVRCHGDDCAAGQKTCPTPWACGIHPRVASL